MQQDFFLFYGVCSSILLSTSHKKTMCDMKLLGFFMLRAVQYFVRIAVLFACLSVFSCGIAELDSDDNRGPGIWIDPTPGGEVSGGGSPSVTESCYVTALEYPKGYDWQADLNKGSVKCSLVVYVDGAPKLKLAVGDDYQVSSDVDMHRIVAGDLYTDFVTDSETILKKNGQELFRWSGRESVKGLVVADDDIYTICQSRSGQGFSFRKNGEAIMVKSRGYVHEHLHYDSEYGLSFSFCETILSQQGNVERHYVMVDSLVTAVGLRDDVDRILDVAVNQGHPCYLASVKGSSNLMLVDGDSLYMMFLPPESTVCAGRLFIIENTIFSEAVIVLRRNVSSVVWKGETDLGFMNEGMTVSAFDYAGGNCCGVFNPYAKGGNVVIYRNSEKSYVPVGYISAGGNTAAFVNGILHIGLSHTEGGKPMLWKDGHTEELDINGFISSVQSVRAVP